MKKMLPTSSMFKQTPNKPTPNPEHPCEVCVAKPVISMGVGWVGVRFNMPLKCFQIIIYIYKIEAIYGTGEMNIEVL